MLMSSKRLAVLVASGVSLLIVTALFLYPSATSSTTPMPVDLGKLAGSAPLDGKVFVGQLGPIDSKPDVNDVWEFSKGMFVSKECERRCKYPPRPYYVRTADGKTEFVSETRCPYKDAKLVWRGTVDSGILSGVMTFTVSRWYWTIEKEFAFHGELRERISPVADNR